MNDKIKLNLSCPSVDRSAGTKRLISILMDVDDEFTIRFPLYGGDGSDTPEENRGEIRAMYWLANKRYLKFEQIDYPQFDEVWFWVRRGSAFYELKKTFGEQRPAVGDVIRALAKRKE